MVEHSGSRISFDIYYSEKPASKYILSIISFTNKPSKRSEFLKFVLQPSPNSWSHCNLSWNKLMHILMGNRRLGYNIAIWNWRKGLLLSDPSPSVKLTDIKSLLYNHDLHLLGVVESDLHGLILRIKRVNPVSTNSILKNLHVDGYSIKLPPS